MQIFLKEFQVNQIFTMCEFYYMQVYKQLMSLTFHKNDYIHMDTLYIKYNKSILNLSETKRLQIIVIYLKNMNI